MIRSFLTLEVLRRVPYLILDIYQKD